MTISLHAGVMTADEKPESSHEYNFFLDRQLQNKLLEFDEQDIDARYFQNVKLDGKAYRAQTRSEEVSGWIFDSKTNFRKPEKEYNNKQPKEFIQPWKDYKTKQQKDDSYMFRHYGDLKKYIQQYREQHSNVNGFRLPGALKSDIPIGDLRKYLHHHSAPTPSAGATQYQTSTQTQTPTQTQVSTVCTQCTNTNSNNQQLITASMYYTNRKESSVSLPNGASVSNPRTTINHSHSHGHQCSKHSHVHINPDHAYKYKLAPDAAWRSDSVQSSCGESDRNDGVKTPRIYSAKGDRGKSPTKVMVPAGASNGPPKGHPLQTVTVQAKQSGGDNTVQASSTSRTLDTLACVAAEKQIEPDFPPDTAGLTWCERLELLRAVNKRPEKVKPKAPRIRFFKDPPKENQDASSPLVAQSTRSHLYEQRRIKHLLEQAKVKGTDQFEWLTDSVRFRGVSSDMSDSSDDDSDDMCSAGGSSGSRCTSTKPYGPGMDVHNAENALLQRYNMPSVKGGGWKMTPYPIMIRSRTTLFQS